jgi:thiamine biosynthesis lipoprotein
MGVGRASWEALGTTAHVLVTNESALPGVAAAVRDFLVRVDATYSRFRADSELSALNAAAGQRVRVSSLLFQAVQTAMQAARATNGAVDPTIGHALRLAGYDRDFAALPAEGTAPTLVVERVPGWQTVELDSTARTIRIPARVSLDLGSTGKALAADLAAAAAYATTDAGVLISLGGDIATAGPPPDGGWRITCSDDSGADPSAGGEVIAIHADAVATSSITVRRWTTGGVVRHHIVDPATGMPAQGPWRTATVVARTCVDANTASTAAIVLGDRAVEWLLRAGLPARLTDHDAQVVRVGGWPAPSRADEAA